MRSAWVAILLAGCGSPAALETPAPPVTRDHVEEGGGSISTKPPQTESLRSCSLDLQSPFGSSAPGWRRETFDAKGRARAAATSNLGAPVTYGDYYYDASGRVTSGPVSGQLWSFTYFEGSSMFQASSSFGAYAYYDLDDRGRISADRGTSSSGSIVASYAYDDANRLITTTQSWGVYQYDYDARGFLAHESTIDAMGTYACHRTWAWTHGDVERVEVQDETGRVTQRCSYMFDDEDRLTSAKCTYSSAIWQYDVDEVTMSLSQGGSVTNLERLKGDCDAPLTRETFARNFVVTAYDPRPASNVYSRLHATAVPSPYKECASVVGPPFGGD
jgi:YD repeat-containing protein